MHYLAFDKEWFLKHQKGLLWLLNFPLTRRWFRWVLRIHRDCPTETILGILPHCYFTAAGTQIVADFRTHAKFGKRLYFAFKPLWWAIHAWDEVFADRFVPAWSYGFSTLTVFPDANPETSTVDGFVRRNGVNESWAAITYSAGNGSSDTDLTAVCAGANTGTTSNAFTNLIRGIFLFDTSAIPDTATVSNATFSLFGNAGNNALGNPTLDICSSAPASNTGLASGDFTSLGSISFGSLAWASYSTTAYNDISLNASGLANISKTGLSKFGTRLDWDLTGIAPTWVNSASSFFNVNYADQAGTTQDPKLVVTYSLDGLLPPQVLVNQAIKRAAYY